jgi:hypothetical protein
MKKFLPLILVGLGLVILLIAVFFIAKSLNNKGAGSLNPEEANVPEIPVAQRPLVELIPTSDGHWLNFKVQNINVTGAVTMDYELIYSTTTGGQQGVPGTVKLTGADIERKLLLGSESSGKFRYDEGVDHGTMTIRFRDAGGKFIGKLATDFHLQSEVTELTSVDGNFTYVLGKSAKGVFFVTMQTFVTPAASVAVISDNGYSVFASDGKPHAGTVATK